MDINPSCAAFGAKHHVTAGVQNVARHFASASLDLVVCNGVFGWGLDNRDDVEKAFSGIARCLAPGGVFVLGWDDTPNRKPFPPEEAATLYFKRHIYEPLGNWRIRTANRHTFDFYVVESKPTS